MPKQIVAPPGYKPRVHGYGRASHEKNSYGDSIPGQEARALDTFAKRFAADYEWGGWHADKVVSAYRIPFFKRPAGAELLADMMPGDILLIDKVDRIWRSVTDFTRLVERLENRGIKIVFSENPELDPTTAHGRLTLTIMVAVAEWESRFKSQRIKEAKARSELAGVGLSRMCLWMPGVIKWQEPNPLNPDKMCNQYAWWPECRVLLMDRIVVLRDVAGMNWVDIAKTVEREMLEHKKRTGDSIYKQLYWRYKGKARPCKMIPRPFLTPDAKKYYIAEKTYRQYGLTDPRDMDRSIHPALSLEEAELVSNPMPEMKRCKPRKFAKTNPFSP